MKGWRCSGIDPDPAPDGHYDELDGIRRLNARLWRQQGIYQVFAIDGFTGFTLRR
jgi:hypothetical protein